MKPQTKEELVREISRRLDLLLLQLRLDLLLRQLVVLVLMIATAPPIGLTLGLLFGQSVLGVVLLVFVISVFLTITWVLFFKFFKD